MKKMEIRMNKRMVFDGVSKPNLEKTLLNRNHIREDS